jgi:hypothetical protein
MYGGFDKHCSMEKNCLHAPVKVAGIGTCSSWSSSDQNFKSSDAIGKL